MKILSRHSYIIIYIYIIILWISLLFPDIGFDYLILIVVIIVSVFSIIQLTYRMKKRKKHRLNKKDSEEIDNWVKENNNLL